MDGSEQRSREIARSVIWFAAATALLFLCAIAVGVFSYVANQHRISDIQANRVFSCQRTYEAFNEVFAPFFPPPEERTRIQQRNLNTLHRTITGLKAKCEKQVDTKGRP